MKLSTTPLIKGTRNVAVSYAIWELINNVVGVYKNRRHGCCDICCIQKERNNLTLEERKI